MDRVITVSKKGHGPATRFRAPADKYAARALWIFLVDNLRAGYIVELSMVDRAGEPLAEIVRASGHKVPAALYASLMEVDDGA